MTSCECVNFKVEEVVVRATIEEIAVQFNAAPVEVQFKSETVEVAFGDPITDVQFKSDPVEITFQDDPDTIEFKLTCTGPPGPRGPAGGDVITLPAGEDLGGQRVVKAIGGKVYYASSDDPLDDVNEVVGVTTRATTAGQDAEIVMVGEMVDAAWNLVDGAVYLGLNGVPTQTPPSAGFMVQVAKVLESNRVFVEVHLPIVRA